MKASSRVTRVVQVVASVALLALAVAIAKPGRLAAALMAANARWLLFSLAFVPVLIALRVFRWHIIARSRRPEIALSESFHSYMGGLTLATVTPLAAGELARGALAAPDDKAGFVGLTIFDKVIDAVTLYTFACAGFVVVTSGWARLGGLAAMAAGFAGWAAAGAIAGALEKRLPASRVTNALSRAIAAARAVRPSVFVRCFLVATANFALYYAHLYVIMYAFSPTIRPEAVGLFPLITLSRVVPSLAGLGARELTAVALFANARYEVSGTAAMEAALLQFVGVNVLPAAVWLAASSGLGRLARMIRGTGGKGD